MKLLLKAFLLLLPCVVVGQNRTYVGVETGPKFELYQYQDNGDGLYTQPFFFSPIIGLTIGQELNRLFTLETGFTLNNYGESYRIRGIGPFNVIGASNAILAFQIPLRLKARIPVIKERISVVPSLGYTLAINDDYNSSGRSGSFSTNPDPQFNDSTRTSAVSTYSFQKTYGLLETALAVEYQYPNEVILYLAGSYLRGFNKVVELDVSYRINDQPEQTGRVFSNGDYFSVVFGIRIPISRAWTYQQED